MQFLRKNKPPGPKGWPYFGVTFEVKIAKLHLTLYDWAKQYGDVFQFNMLGQKFICINSVDVLRDTFLKEPNATITGLQLSTVNTVCRITPMLVCFPWPTLDQTSKAHLSTASYLWGRLDLL